VDLVVLAVITSGHRVLIIRRALTSADMPDLVWAFPGGKVEDGETLEQAVIREVAEETGLHLVDVHLLHARIIPRTTRLALYYHFPLPDLQTDGFDVWPAPEFDQREISAVAWVSGQEALSMFTSDVAPAIATFLRQSDLRCSQCILP
jgi:8-oxo-dGTP diphosphatase